jgi:hypothetical protein
MMRKQLDIKSYDDSVTRSNCAILVSPVPDLTEPTKGKSFNKLSTPECYFEMIRHFFQDILPPGICIDIRIHKPQFDPEKCCTSAEPCSSGSTDSYGTSDGMIGEPGSSLGAAKPMMHDPFERDNEFELTSEAKNPHEEFVSVCCNTGPSEESSCKDVFRAWVAWCARNGRDKPGVATVLGRNLRIVVKNLGAKQKFGQRGRFYRGLSLKPPNQMPGDLIGQTGEDRSFDFTDEDGVDRF